MAINKDKPQLWKQDIRQSVDKFNDWFMTFAPKAFRETRTVTADRVRQALIGSNNLTDLTPQMLLRDPGLVSTLRMSTCPPIAVDRLIGLSGAKPSLIKTMEKGELPARMSLTKVRTDLEKVLDVVNKMMDRDIFVWLDRTDSATDEEVSRASAIVADRLCGAISNPIIRNAQELRQLGAISEWLSERGYTQVSPGTSVTFEAMPLRSFAFRMNVPGELANGTKVNIPVDAVVRSPNAKYGDMPILIEAKSAGDFANVNKRRKEEKAKMDQLRAAYGENVQYILFLCGYFDGGYLGYEAIEGIDWVWEHRIDDLEAMGL